MEIITFGVFNPVSCLDLDFYNWTSKYVGLCSHIGLLIHNNTVHIVYVTYSISLFQYFYYMTVNTKLMCSKGVLCVGCVMTHN